MNASLALDMTMWAVFERAGAKRSGRPKPWTEEDRQFVRDHLGRMTLDEIAGVLGRSRNAVKIVQTRCQMTAPSKREGVLTGNGVAGLLQMDIHAVLAWHERGILRFDVMAGERGILLIRQERVYRWAVNPLNWIYFRPERVSDEHLAKLLRRQAERWEDAWWRVGEVAKYHGVCTSIVARYCANGNMRSAVRWGNWWVRRSEAMTYPFIKGRGMNKRIAAEKGLPVAARAFLARALDEGLTYAEIGRLMKRDETWVGHQARKLKMEAENRTDNKDYRQ